MIKVQLTPLSQTSIELIDGDRGVNYPNKRDFSAENFCLFLNSSNLTKNGFDFSSKVFITKQKDDSMGNGKLLDGDIVINTRGTIGNVGLYSKKVHFEHVRINSGMLIIRSGKDFDNRFLYLFLRSKFFFSQVQNIMSGSVQKQLPVWIFNYINVPKLAIEGQNKIASALSALDDKIELNKKINSELEQLAKTLYEYWFVQFDFPDKNGKPYKSSGGEMVWSEMLKKEIPKGWEVIKMNEILRKKTQRFELNSEKHNLDTIDLSVMPGSTMCLGEKNSSDEFETNLFKMNKFDILFGGIRPYLRKAGFAPFDGVVTGTVHAFETMNEFDYNFSVLTMVHESMFQFAISNSKGTKMPVISADDLLEYKVAYQEAVVKRFNEILSYKETISCNIIENHKLAELRDWLLPMLMNGQAIVK